MRRDKRKEGKVYTRLSRFNVVLTFEQYKFLLERKRKARELDERVKYKDLVGLWGIKQYHMAGAVYRGIRQYDDRIKAEGGNRNVNDCGQSVPTRRVERRNESCPLGLWAKSAEARRAILREYTESGTVRRGYSPLVRVEYFED
jgi:hypothetical protein